MSKETTTMTNKVNNKNARGSAAQFFVAGELCRQSEVSELFNYLKFIQSTYLLLFVLLSIEVLVLL